MSATPGLCDLNQSTALPPSDQPATARRHRRRSDVAEEHTLVAVAGHDQTRRGQLPEALDDRFEQRPGGAAAAPCDDEVQADVAGLWQELEQRQQRIRRTARDEVVVVDQHETLR